MVPWEPVPKALKSQDATRASGYLMFINSRAGGRPEPREKGRLSGQHRRLHTKPQPAEPAELVL